MKVKKKLVFFYIFGYLLELRIESGLKFFLATKKIIKKLKFHQFEKTFLHMKKKLPKRRKSGCHALQQCNDLL
jgi:hypothetical protein